MRQRNTKSDTKRFVMCPFCSARTNTAEMEPDSAACSACRGNLVVVDDCLSSDSRVACPACEQRYELTAEILNQTISCTMCELPFAVVQVRTAQTTRDGRPVPALNKPAEIFRRLFGPVTEYEKKNSASRGSIIDNVLEEAKSLNTRLGKNDRSKMDEYLTSVRDVEKDVQRSTEWMNIPKANLDENMFALDAQPTDPRKYLKVMYDLIALAFQTDTLRVATFQTGDERSHGVANNFPVALGFSKDAHGLSHADNFDEPALYISALNEIYSDFLKKLNSFQEGDATVLDNTIAMYGSGGSIVHVAVNYPLILSGGQNLGFKHGFHHKYSEDIHLTNLFVTIANRLSVTTKGFADSTGFLQV